MFVSMHHYQLNTEQSVCGITLCYRIDSDVMT